MTFGLTGNIDKKVNADIESVKSILEHHLTDTFQFFPDKLLQGKIIGDRLTAKINPPIGWVDPFRSRVSGQIIGKNNTTSIVIKIRMSLTVLFILILWFVLITLTLIKFEYKNISDSFQFIGLTIIYALVPLLLFRLKLHFDKGRLDKLVCEISNGA